MQDRKAFLRNTVDDYRKDSTGIHTIGRVAVLLCAHGKALTVVDEDSFFRMCAHDQDHNFRERYFIQSWIPPRE